MKNNYFVNSGYLIKQYTDTNSLPHCEEGPACFWSDGQVEWYKNGLLHRLDGPAIVTKDGICEYYINNFKYTKKNYWKHQDVIIYQKLKELIC